MLRLFDNSLVGHLDLYECDPPDLSDLGRKYAPALPACISSNRWLRPVIGTLEALRGIAALLGQRLVAVQVATLMSWQGLARTETNRRKIRSDLLRLAKLGLIHKGTRENSRGRTLSVAVCLQPVLFLDSHCPPMSKEGCCEMVPRHQSEPEPPLSFDGGEISPPISEQEGLAEESLSDYDDPYPDAPDSFPPHTLKNNPVVVERRDPVDKLDKRKLTYWRNMSFSEFVDRNNLGTRSGKLYDIWEELTDDAEKRGLSEPWDDPGAAW